jgi:hypothetical protein
MLVGVQSLGVLSNTVFFCSVAQPQLEPCRLQPGASAMNQSLGARTQSRVPKASSPNPVAKAPALKPEPQPLTEPPP